MISEDYKQFVNEKVWDYLPPSKTKVGDDISFRCPFCGDSKKSSTKKRGHYSLTKCAFHCFNCDVSMSGLKLLQALSGAAFDDIKTEYIKLKLKNNGFIFSKKDLAEPSNLSCLQNLKNIIKPEWKNPLSEKAQQYLANRSVSKAPFLKDKLYSVYDKSQNEYILIPWRINGIDCFYQLNDFQKIDKFNRKYIFPPKTEKPVFGLDNIDLSWNKIIVFEGVYDSLFVKNGICCGGKNLTDYQYNLIKERYPKQQIVIALDNDEAGLTSAGRMIKKDPGKFHFFKWFDVNTKAKDINDYVLQTGNTQMFADKNILDKMIVSSVEMKMFLLQKGYWK